MSMPRTSARLSTKKHAIVKIGNLSAVSIKNSSQISKKLAIKKRKNLAVVIEKPNEETQKMATQIETKPSQHVDILDETHFNNAIQHMKKHDPKLASYLDEAALAAFKERLNRSDGTNPFKSFTRSIVYQQVSGKAAANVLGRFVNLFNTSNREKTPDWFPTPQDVLAKDLEELRTVGLSGRKAEYIQNLAQHFVDKCVTPEKFSSMTDQEISDQLCSVKGIGQWSVDMFLLLDLHFSDVLPLGDLAVRKGIVKHFGLPKPANNKKIFPLPPQMKELTEIWRPYRSLGSWLMWRIQAIKVVGDD